MGVDQLGALKPYALWLKTVQHGKPPGRRELKHAETLRRGSSNAITVKVIIGVRFAYGLRIAGPILIGTSAVPPLRFALFSSRGAVIWAAVIAGLGWLLGQVIEAALGEVRRYEGTTLVAVLISAEAYALIRRSRKS